MLKDILVHLDGGSDDDNRLAHALGLARQYEAHLTGLVCIHVPGMSMMGGDMGLSSAKLSAQIIQESNESGDALEAKYIEVFKNLDVLSEVRRLDLQGGSAAQVIAAETRTADLFVSTRPYNHKNNNSELLEGVLFSSGRACLFVPPAVPPEGDVKTIVLAWRNTRESARAVAEALPLLVGADKVVIAMISQGEAPQARGDAPSADIAKHLTRHGVKVEVNYISGWDDAAAALLNECDRVDADMLVMGGYGHSRFREWVLGGVTRTVLSKADLPVLIAH